MHRHGTFIAAQLPYRLKPMPGHRFQPVAPSYFRPEAHSVIQGGIRRPGAGNPRRLRTILRRILRARPCAAPEADFDACRYCARVSICAFMSPLTDQRATATAAVSMPDAALRHGNHRVPPINCGRKFTPSYAASSGTNCARRHRHGTTFVHIAVASRWALPR